MPIIVAVKDGQKLSNKLLTQALTKDREILLTPTIKNKGTPDPRADL